MLEGSSIKMFEMLGIIFKSYYYENTELFLECFLILIGALFIWWIWNYTNSKEVFMSKQEPEAASIPDIHAQNEINDVLFFSTTKCNLDHLQKILQYLSQAEKSLDICVYTITDRNFADCIVERFKKGKKVRVITDLSMSYGDGSQIINFRKSEIPVRGRRNTSFLMHHKFAVIDSSFLINGSLNWTNMGVSGNDENVTITSNTVLVSKYQYLFNALWKELDY